MTWFAKDLIWSEFNFIIGFLGWIKISICRDHPPYLKTCLKREFICSKDFELSLFYCVFVKPYLCYNFLCKRDIIFAQYLWSFHILIYSYRHLWRHLWECLLESDMVWDSRESTLKFMDSNRKMTLKWEFKWDCRVLLTTYISEISI